MKTVNKYISLTCYKHITKCVVKYNLNVFIETTIRFVPRVQTDK